MSQEEKLPLEQAWKKWIACLKGDDPNTIYQQIYMMVWDTAIFKTVVEGRKLRIKMNPDSPEVNGAFHSFIDRNYFQSQCACVRRLTDKSYPLTGKRGVFSLTALINDIELFREDLTREKYFSLRNLPYDYKELQNKQRDYVRDHSSGKFIRIPPELDWEPIEEAHQLFDRLSQTTSTNRNPTDIINERVVDRLVSRLETCERITKYVDKFVAHSASPESRSYLDEKTLAVTLRQLWDAHQIIFNVAEFLSLIILSESHMALVWENLSFFDFWDVPLFYKDENALVRTALEEYRKETEKWNIDGVGSIWQWIEA